MSPLRSWNDFWFRPTSARPIGAFRVVIGVIALCHLAMLTVDLDHWLTGQGLMQGTEARELAGPLRPSPLHYSQGPLAVRAFLGVTAAVAVAFTLGWRTRVTSVLLYLGVLSIHNRNALTNSGPDTLLLLMLFYLMLAPCGAAYSLDSRRLARRRLAAGEGPSEPLIVPWAQRLIQIHLSLIYFDTAVLKCAGTSWLGGTALHYVLHNREVGRFDVSWLTTYPMLVNVLTYAGLVGEFGLAIMLWNRAARPLAIAFGLALHAGIMVIVNVPLFGELMTACYLTYLSPGEWDSVARTLDVRRWMPAARRPAAVLPSGVRLDAPGAPSGARADVGEAVDARPT